MSDSFSVCPKCGSGDVITRYHEGVANGRFPCDCLAPISDEPLLGEHLGKLCQDCLYKWYAECLQLIGYIYLLEWNGFYKIGFAYDVERRVRQLSTLPTVINTIHTIRVQKETPRTLEYWLHAKFAEHRVTGYGAREWFSLPEESVTWICGIQDGELDEIFLRDAAPQLPEEKPSSRHDINARFIAELGEFVPDDDIPF